MGRVLWRKAVCTVVVLWAVTAISLPAQIFTTLHSFDKTDGSDPQAQLVQGTDGNLYGTTSCGGVNPGIGDAPGIDCGNDADGAGTVFGITPTGTLTTLYNFCSQTDCADGGNPVAGLVLGPNSKLYGATGYGGPNHDGTIFDITLGGQLTTLHVFNGVGDGAFPLGGLIQGSDGEFYGTTYAGGTVRDRSTCSAGCGTVFKMLSGGSLVTLQRLNSNQTSFPKTGLVQANDGSFYGTTSGVQGSVFDVNPQNILTTLYVFGAISTFPNGLVQSGDGNFYGTTFFGGFFGGQCAPAGCGMIYRMSPNGALTKLFSFDLSDGNGASPAAGLIQATDGNFYGTTTYGGVSQGGVCPVVGRCGTIFKITPDGVLTALYSFCSQTNCSDGFKPTGALFQATDGNFYGTTSSGGTGSNCQNGCGTVFSLSVGLAPFVRTSPSFGTVGSAVSILGTNLTGATSVTFNGVDAAFKVVSNTQITAMVPTGATTGEVEVVTPNGTLSSNVNFRVTP